MKVYPNYLGHTIPVPSLKHAGAFQLRGDGILRYV
jgi:hypothetical protein